MRVGYEENTECWLCGGRSWLEPFVCVECNPRATRDYVAIKELSIPDLIEIMHRKESVAVV